MIHYGFVHWDGGVSDELDIAMRGGLDIID